MESRAWSRAAGEAMAGTTDDAEAAAERLEAALERIARMAEDPRQRPVASEIKDRLDRVIQRLRAALDS